MLILYTHICTYIYTYIYIYTHIYVYIYTHMYIHGHIYIYIYIYNMATHTYTYIYIYIYVFHCVQIKLSARPKKITFFFKIAFSTMLSSLVFWEGCSEHCSQVISTNPKGMDANQEKNEFCYGAAFFNLTCVDPNPRTNIFCRGYVSQRSSCRSGAMRFMLLHATLST